MARADTACTGPYKDLSIANFSDVLWASASSSCSSLLLGTGVRDSDKVMVMSKDGHITDACSISPRDEASLSISTHNTTFTAAIVAAATTTAMPNTTDNCIPPLTQDHKRNFSYANLPPELIVHIFKFLVSAHDLRSAILVCKMWCNCGMDLLWSKPSLSTFATAERMVQAMAGPNTVFPYADYIRRLNLSFLAPDLTDLILGHFALCSRLERLLLAGSINITDAGLRRILSNCAGLCSLDLSEIPAITDALLESVAGGCPRLHTLYLGSCSSITDDSVVRIATSCPQLKR
ncbi:SCF ubiquitin ligase complex subunit, partial [Gamsiella multidivaricata]